MPIKRIYSPGVLSGGLTVPGLRLRGDIPLPPGYSLMPKILLPSHTAQRYLSDIQSAKIPKVSYSFPKTKKPHIPGPKPVLNPKFSSLKFAMTNNPITAEYYRQGGATGPFRLARCLGSGTKANGAI